MPFINGNWSNSGGDGILNKLSTDHFQVGFQVSPLANSIYDNAPGLAQSVYNDAHELWAREDSAYQRMVEDMKKAGLNPWLGVSSGGSQTSQVNPSMDSLTSLLSVLSGTLQSEQTFTQSSKRLFDSVIQALTIGLKFL